VWLLVKDADLYPVTIQLVSLRVSDATGRTAAHAFEPDRRCEANYQHLAFPLPMEGFSGDVRIDGRIAVEDARGRRKVFSNHNFPGLEQSPLELSILESPLPYPREWLAGEMHCHSEYTSDMVEFGAPLELMQQAADAVGLDFVLCTDHSYSFPYRRDRYHEATDAEANFAEYRARVAAQNAARPGSALLVAGEEISCGNSRGENVHLLAFGHDRFIPGNGDGGRRGLRNRPDHTVAEVLEMLGPTPSFAAHPAGHQGFMERLLLRRGPWREADVRPDAAGRVVRGLQFWNGSLDREYRDGKALWIGELLRGNRLLPIGANDAHGDFNRNTRVGWPLISLRQGRNHVFGRARTLAPSAGRDADSLRAAFRGDRCVCTDGPFADVSREDGRLRVAAFTTPDYGELRSVTILGAEAGESAERSLASWSFEKGPFHFEERIELPLSSGYLRLEAVTRRGRRALTAAVFVG
jgi:hypothetical protein